MKKVSSRRSSLSQHSLSDSLMEGSETQILKEEGMSPSDQRDSSEGQAPSPPQDHMSKSAPRSFKKLGFGIVFCLLAGSFYLHFKTFGELKHLNQAFESSPKEDLNPFEKHMNILEANVQSFQGKTLEQLSTLAQKIKELEEKGSKEGGNAISAEDFKSIDARISTALKAQEKGTNEAPLIQGLVFLRLLQDFLDQGRPYAQVLTPLKALFEKNQWITTEVQAAFDILHLSAAQGLPSFLSLHDFPKKNTGSFQWPPYLKWIGNFVQIEDNQQAQGFSNHKLKRLETLLAHHRLDESIAFVKRSIEDHPSEQESWKSWLQIAETHQKIRKSMLLLQHALLVQEGSHGTN